MIKTRRNNVFLLRIALSLLSLLGPCYLSAAPVSVDDARRAVGNWLRSDAALGCKLGHAIKSARTCSTAKGAVFHVVELDGDGFVVTSSDTEMEPIVAFSADDDLAEDKHNPLWVLLQRDADVRQLFKEQNSNVNATSNLQKKVVASSLANTSSSTKWARLLAQDEVSSNGLMRKENRAGLSTLSDVRVPALVKSRWYQKNDSYGRKCYNYFTPNGYHCGCVATAAAQIMRYFQYPDYAVDSIANVYCFVDGVQTTLVTQGGIYDWSRMPLQPMYATTDEERREIGKLCSDVGIACGMSYLPNGSGTGGYMISDALTRVFGYANAVPYQSQFNMSDRLLRTALISNLDAGLPVAVSIATDEDEGHEVIGDGYGYSDGTLYCHFNMGWGGTYDAWYAPPNIDGGYNFTVFDGVVYNIFTNPNYKGCSIVSGRALDMNGVPIVGALVRALDRNRNIIQAVRTKSNGIYALILPAGSLRATNYTIRSEYAGAVGEKAVSLKKCVGTTITEDGYYYTETGSINNICDNDISLLGTASSYPSVREPDISDFKITSFVMKDGEPQIICSPSAEVLRQAGYDVEVVGTDSLSPILWQPISPTHHFFKVILSRP